MNDGIVELKLDDLPVMKSRTPQKSRKDIIKPVVEYTADGDFVAEYESAREASRRTHIPTDTIYALCKNTQKIASNKNGNRIFLYRGDDIAKRLEEIEANKDNYKFLHPHAHGKEVIEYTLGGKFLFKYPMSTIAAKVNKVTPALIASCCRGSRLFIGKRIFLYPGDNIKERVKLVKQELYRLSNKRPKYKPVDVYTLDGKFIKGYPSASAASKDLNIHVSNITRCCSEGDKHGKNKFTAKGYIFLWTGDSISDRLEIIKQLQNKK